MTVAMDELERLLKRYVSTGAAVVVVLLGPGQADTRAPGTPPPSGQATTVEPSPPGGGIATADPTAEPRATTPPRPTTEPRRAPADRAGVATDTTAAAAHGWGTPTRVEDFDGGTAQWQLYDGTGHDGKGRRAPEAVSVRDGVLTITGDPSGTTGGLSWGKGRRYGRWEARVRAPAADPSYNAVLLLWPDAEKWPAGGEIDFMEMGDPARRTTDAFVHYGKDNRQVHGSVTTDATRWHNWAVEWTPSSITTYLDGREWYRVTDAAVQPPGPMHLCIQLDWFPEGGAVRRSTMQVDRVREYAVDTRDAAG
ncbi:MAG: hypothetical protein QOK35_2503 [Pseudonocardiales bacterium]|nr:hypothetical protein [Pseudonocardiales bacterium]